MPTRSMRTGKHEGCIRKLVPRHGVRQGGGATVDGETESIGTNEFKPNCVNAALCSESRVELSQLLDYYSLGSW